MSESLAIGRYLLDPLSTAISDIPEGCDLFGPRNAPIFIISDRLLPISHAMYLDSKKVALNKAKNTVFLHFYKNIYVHAILYRKNLNFSKLFCLEDGKSVKYLANRSERVQYYLECQGFNTFSGFHTLHCLLK